jgi:hypothetical protein
MGQAVHHGLWSQATDVADPGLAAKDYYLDKRKEHWGGTMLEEWEESADLVYRMVNEYVVKEWPKHNFKVVHTEKQLSVPLGEVCWSCGAAYPEDVAMDCQSCGADVHYWVGTMDLLVNRIINGKDHFAILDHKTTGGTPSDHFLNGFANSFQLLGYTYAAQKDSGLDVREYGVNALQKAKTIGTDAAESKTCGDCRNGKKKVLTCDTCNRTGKVEKKIVLEPFRRKFFPVEDSDIDRFVLWAHRTVQSISAELDRLETEPEVAFPMNDKQCNWGPCQYKAVCWENRNALQWAEPPKVLLEGLKPKPKDYVDAIASEEVS